MKVESRTILGAFTFLVVVAGVYWYTVAVHGHASERAGIDMLVFSFCAYGMLGLYLFAQYRRRHGQPRVEDRFDATQEDGAGVIDYFPSASIWPVGMGLGMILGACALIWGLWYVYLGALMFFGSVAGWVTESDYTEDVLPGVDPAELSAHEVPALPTQPHHGLD